MDTEIKNHPSKIGLVAVRTVTNIICFEKGLTTEFLCVLQTCLFKGILLYKVRCPCVYLSPSPYICQAWVQVQGLSQISKRHGPGACSHNQRCRSLKRPEKVS